MFFESKFSSYRQLSSVEFPLASFLSAPDENGSGSLHENYLVRFRADLLSRWSSSGTASSSVWNGSISPLVNARPIRTVLVRFHMEPFRVNGALACSPTHVCFFEWLWVLYLQNRVIFRSGRASLGTSWILGPEDLTLRTICLEIEETSRRNIILPI